MPEVAAVASEQQVSEAKVAEVVLSPLLQQAPTLGVIGVGLEDEVALHERVEVLADGGRGDF